MSNGLEILPGETCVNCDALVWKTDNEWNVVCSSMTCGRVQVRQSAPEASIYECISCNTRISQWLNNPPYRNHDPDISDCPPTSGEHDWICVKHSTVDLTKQDDN